MARTTWTYMPAGDGEPEMWYPGQNLMRARPREDLYDGEPIEGAELRRGYLIRRIHQGFAGKGRSVRYHLRQTPGRTNQEDEPLLEGWLGTTDDISEDALGYCVVEEVKQVDGPVHHVTLRFCAPPAGEREKWADRCTRTAARDTWMRKGASR